jgi:cation transport regulator ChaC
MTSARGPTPGSHPRLPDAEAAARLATASGPLGSNLEYLRHTHDGLAAHGIVDPNISRLLGTFRSIE